MGNSWSSKQPNPTTRKNLTGDVTDYFTDDEGHEIGYIACHGEYFLVRQGNVISTVLHTDELIPGRLVQFDVSSQKHGPMLRAINVRIVGHATNRIIGYKKT